MTKNRMSSKYELGVEVFIEFGLRHDNGSNSIRYPYLKCGNRVFEDVTIVKYGFRMVKILPQIKYVMKRIIVQMIIMRKMTNFLMY